MFNSKYFAKQNQYIVLILFFLLFYFSNNGCTNFDETGNDSGNRTDGNSNNDYGGTENGFGGSTNLEDDLDPRWAQWPMKDIPSFEIQVYVVVDSVTGLMWQRSIHKESHTQAEAYSYCKDLYLSGYNDWRLPTRIELASILDYNRDFPVIDTTAFPDASSDSIWTSSVVAYDYRYSWYVTLEGDVLAKKADDRILARCVRNKNKNNIKHYSRIGNGVKDNKTGLIWYRDVAPGRYTWAEAKAYCSGMGGNWRLPSVKEMQTLVDETQSNPAIDFDAFPNAPSNFFWTSSALISLSRLAWSVYIGNGSVSGFPKDESIAVRCVHDED